MLVTATARPMRFCAPPIATPPNGSKPEMAFTMRRLAAPGLDPHTTALQALALSASDQFTFGDVLELRFGSELQTIQFMGRVTAFRPFGSADLHLSPNTVLEYRYATSEPDSRMEKGFDSAPADLSESGPHVSLAGFPSTLERAHHHEVSLSHRMGDTNLQVAMYSDRVADPALTGVGDASSDSGDVLPDVSPRPLPTGERTGRAWNAGGVAAQTGVRPYRDTGLWLRWSARSEATQISRCRTRAATAWYGTATPPRRNSAGRCPAPRHAGLLPTAGSAGRRSRRWICSTPRRDSPILI